MTGPKLDANELLKRGALADFALAAADRFDQDLAYRGRLEAAIAAAPGLAVEGVIDMSEDIFRGAGIGKPKRTRSGNPANLADAIFENGRVIAKALAMAGQRGRGNPDGGA